MNVNNDKLPVSAGALVSSRFTVIFLSLKELVGYQGSTHLQDKQGQCIEQCQKIMKGTLCLVRLNNSGNLGDPIYNVTETFLIEKSIFL